MNTNAKIIWGSKPENYPIKFAIRANQRTLNKSIFEFNRCFDDRYFMQPLFCASLFCDRGFDVRCFMIAVLNVDRWHQPQWLVVACRLIHSLVTFCLHALVQCYKHLAIELLQ